MTALKISFYARGLRRLIFLLQFPVFHSFQTVINRLPSSTPSKSIFLNTFEIRKRKETSKFRDRSLIVTVRDHSETLTSFDPTCGYGDMTGVKSFDDAWINAFRWQRSLQIVSIFKALMFLFLSERKIAFVARSGGVEPLTCSRLF